MAKARKQHYVPISYLRRFASENNVYVRDLVERKTFRTCLENIGHIRDFYSLVVDDESKDNLVEKYFSEVEGKASTIIDQFIRTMKLPVDQAWGHLTEFVAGMHLRVPDFLLCRNRLFSNHVVVHLYRSTINVKSQGSGLPLWSRF